MLTFNVQEQSGREKENLYKFTLPLDRANLYSKNNYQTFENKVST